MSNTTSNIPYLVKEVDCSGFIYMVIRDYGEVLRRLSDE